MKILIFAWDKFCKINNESDMTEAFEALGHEVVCCDFDMSVKNRYSDKGLIQYCAEAIQNNTPSIAFSFGYFPVIAHACKTENILYFSWVYDNPSVLLYSYTLSFETNRVFVFDYDTYDFFHNKEGIKQVRYLPMAANVARLDKLLDDDMFKSTEFANAGELAFVGSLYQKKANLFDRMENLSEYTWGYLHALINAQMGIYGHSIVERMLTPELLAEMLEELGLKPDVEGVETYTWLYANYVINPKITAIEREQFITRIAENHKVDLYSDSSIQKEGIINHGFVDYYEMAPYVFRNAKINLNITLRSIVNGIPLRCFDIMGAGGFLLTNYQADMLRYFEPGKDYVSFESEEDMIAKVDYYLNPRNEAERKEIAISGHDKIMNNHTYYHRAKEMLSIL